MAPRVESVLFNGITFRRYPNGKNSSERDYYRPGSADAAQGIESLHREVWKSINGPIPDGYHVHHIDHDPANNDPSNLACISRAEHLAHHGDAHRTDRQMENWRYMQQMSSAWHSTPEGLAWHSKQAIESWKRRQPVSSVCEQCGTSYESLRPERFCSNACKSAWRRASGLDDVDRVCVWCGATFRINRYSKARTCSRKCGQQLRRASERAQPQP